MEIQIKKKAINDPSTSFSDALMKLYDSTFNAGQRNTYRHFFELLFDCKDKRALEGPLLHMVSLLKKNNIGFDVQGFLPVADGWDSHRQSEADEFMQKFKYKYFKK